MDTSSDVAKASGLPSFTDAEACAKAVVETVGKDIRLALPLGLGKANKLTNALYAMAKADPSIKLNIYTALNSY